MSKETLIQRVLADSRIQIYDCGRRDIQAGAIDRRVLALLEFLVASGFNPTITSLHCGHSYLTASGNVSEHSIGHRRGHRRRSTAPRSSATRARARSPTSSIQRLLTLQGTMKPHQIISLMDFPDADNTLVLADHDDHIHVGFHATGAAAARRGPAQRDPQARAVGPPDRAPRRDRQPDRAAQPLQGRAEGRRRPARPATTDRRPPLPLRPVGVRGAPRPPTRPLRRPPLRGRRRPRGHRRHRTAARRAAAAAANP